ncbi:hypothetical protein BBP40_003684 [Aspergillus hancockii]|nr:hypothetical protein BBP40_003684 [Aspergillus hancockii]
MKLYYISLTLTVILSPVIAQGLNSLPDCASVVDYRDVDEHEPISHEYLWFFRQLCIVDHFRIWQQLQDFNYLSIVGCY